MVGSGLEMSPWLLAPALAAAAVLYASVGHGGASAYLVVMGLAGFASESMRPIALVLNIGVSAVALGHFVRAGCFQGRLFFPLVATSMVAAFLGGCLKPPEAVFRGILGAALAVGVWRLLSSPSKESMVRVPGAGVLLLVGAGIGFLSGLVGIGGGIFLTPLLVLCGWAGARVAAGVSAAFILVNSVAGIAGFLVAGGRIPQLAWGFLLCVLVGGWLGARWGSGLASVPALRRSLALVMALAAMKFIVIS